MPNEQDIRIFSGNANVALSKSICDYLSVSLGDARLVRFSDGEIFVEINENVRGTNVFVVQSTCNPVNEHLMELCIMIDALKRASAKTICAVLPYYGYARQDRKVAPRTPITAKLVADMLSAAGATRVLSVDLHAGQIQGFFNIPFDNLFAKPVLLEHICQHYDPAEAVIVSPDAGGVERARSYAKGFGGHLAICDKRRTQANVAEIMHVIGDVDGKHAILIDDMVDTAGTVTQAASALKAQGARSVAVYCTHPVFSGPALERFAESEIERLVVTDTIELGVEAKKMEMIEVLPIAPLLAKALRRIHVGESVSSLFV